ncbi:hypothetical protein MtrunA17_Chr8g0351831 [Medicago truncatula]|uniref:Transmembrane protein n=1 Tax=Medicago truncatula TaxID=3880 RepID=A0A396GIJ4_MEDTR|nr:hypothetical protein MtrunA17_Chr8g0351831 [Medicago truncatula]
MSLLKHPRVAVLSLSLYHNQSLQQVVCSTGMLLVAFLPRSVATIIGTLVAFLIVPTRSLGSDKTLA